MSMHLPDYPDYKVGMTDGSHFLTNAKGMTKIEEAYSSGQPGRRFVDVSTIAEEGHAPNASIKVNVDQITTIDEL